MKSNIDANKHEIKLLLIREALMRPHLLKLVNDSGGGALHNYSSFYIPFVN